MVVCHQSSFSDDFINLGGRSRPNSEKKQPENNKEKYLTSDSERKSSTQIDKDDIPSQSSLLNIRLILEKKIKDLTLLLKDEDKKAEETINLKQNNLKEETDSVHQGKNDRINQRRKKKKAKKLVKKLRDDVNKNLCLNCKKNDRKVLLLPCKHFNSCEECAETYKKCPDCNKSIKEKIKVFIN